MSSPIPPSKRKKKSQDEEDEEALMNEVYGPKGAALRKTLATPHQYGKPATETADSTFGQRLKARIRKMTSG